LHGRDLFQGGFLGLDNIGVFNRDQALPNGRYLEPIRWHQLDGDVHAGLMRIALNWRSTTSSTTTWRPSSSSTFSTLPGPWRIWAVPGSDFGTKKTASITTCSIPDGQTVPMRIRSMVGLIPLFAVETLDPELLEKVPGFNRRMEWFLTYRPDLAMLVSRWFVPGKGERKLLSLLRGTSHEGTLAQNARSE
jgi:hypothetical protein